MVLMIPTKVIKAIFQENVSFMELWVSRCIDQCLVVWLSNGTPQGNSAIVHNVSIKEVALSVKNEVPLL